PRVIVSICRGPISASHQKRWKRTWNAASGKTRTTVTRSDSVNWPRWKFACSIQKANRPGRSTSGAAWHSARKRGTSSPPHLTPGPAGRRSSVSRRRLVDATNYRTKLLEQGRHTSPKHKRGDELRHPLACASGLRAEFCPVALRRKRLEG